MLILSLADIITTVSMLLSTALLLSLVAFQLPLPAKEDSELAAFLTPLSSAEQAAQVEEQLKARPDDKHLHIQLLAYYHDSAEKEKDRGNAKMLWARQVFWLIDHDPKSAAFELPFESSTIIFAGGFGLADDSLAAEARQHWERVVASSPKDLTILQHYTEQLYQISPALAIPTVKKMIELNPSCGDCHDRLGNVMASSVLDLGRADANGRACLHSDPAQLVAVRNELAGTKDARALIVAGLTILNDSSFHADKCKADKEDIERYALDLVRKAVRIDPSLKERYKDHWIFQGIAAKL
jgi:hypothetical protein